MAGFRVLGAVDKDDDLVSSYPKNFPTIPVVKLDLSSTAPSELLKSIGISSQQVLGIVGGPPCQGFSYIGKRDPNDPRNFLVYKFFEFVIGIKPGFFVFENVPGLLTEPFVKVLEASLELVTTHGIYEVQGPTILDAADFGAATQRPRVFVIGYRSQYMEEIDLTPIQNHLSTRQATVQDAILDVPSPSQATKGENGDYWGRYTSEPISDLAIFARKLPPRGLASEHVRETCSVGLVSGLQPTNHTQRVLQRFSRLRQGERDEVYRSSRLSWQAPSPVLRAGTGKERGSFQALRPIHPSEHRVITVREAARIQGFPDWFQFHRTKWHSFRMIGNSVSPLVSTAMLSQVRKSL